MSITPATRVKISADKKKITWIAGQTNMTYGQVIRLIERILTETMDATMKDVKIWINKYVAKRTGQLRESLIKNINSSWVRKGVLRIVVGTNIDYASDVDKMSTAMVRHSSPKEHSGDWAYAYYYGYHGRIQLHDPMAVGGFWEKLLVYTKERAKVNLLKSKRRFLGFRRNTGAVFKGVA